jgi:hypothetical protein
MIKKEKIFKPITSNYRTATHFPIFFRMRFINWALLFAYGSALTVQVSKLSIEEHFSAFELFFLVEASISRAESLESLARMADSYGLSLEETLEESCVRWNRSMYENVRKFVCENRNYDRFLLSPQCIEGLLTRSIIDSKDLEDNRKDKLLASAPRSLTSENFQEYFMALQDIESIDRHEVYRRNFHKFQNVDWEIFFKDPSLILATPIHFYITAFDVICFLPFEEQFADLSLAYVDMHEGNVDVLLGSAAIVFERLFDNRWAEISNVQVVSIYSRVIQNVARYTSRVDDRYKTLFDWWFANGSANFPDIFQDDDLLSFIKVALVIQGVQLAPPSPSLVKVFQKRFLVLADYEASEFARIIAKFKVDKTCAPYIEYEGVLRIMDLPAKYTGSAMPIFSCLSSEEGIEHFRRWQRPPFVSIPNFADETKFREYFSMPDVLLYTPPPHPETRSWLEAELVRLLVVGLPITGNSKDGQVVSLSLEADVLSKEPPAIIAKILPILILVLMLRLHFDESKYELDRSWALMIACGSDGSLTANSLNDIWELVAAIQIAYNIECRY